MPSGSQPGLSAESDYTEHLLPLDDSHALEAIFHA